MNIRTLRATEEYERAGRWKSDEKERTVRKIKYGGIREYMIYCL